MKTLANGITILRDDSVLLGNLSSGNIKVETINEEFEYVDSLESSSKKIKLSNPNYITQIRSSNTLKSKKNAFHKISVKDSVEIVIPKAVPTLSDISNENVICCVDVDDSSLSEFVSSDNNGIKVIENESNHFIGLDDNEDDTFTAVKEEAEFITVNGPFLEEADLPEQTVTEVIEDAGHESDSIQLNKAAKESAVLIKVSESDDNPDVGNTSLVQSRKRIKVNKDDARNRVHFVKYMKKDGKTIKKFECGICLKEFVHQYTLMRHLPTHTDERNFQCNMCDKAFRQMSTLAQHKATHSQSRPYVCDVCKKTFSRVSTLISHKKTHTDQKQHICHVCKKAFHQKGNLKNHLFTHSNERPYKCDVCGRGFNQSSNLQCHKIKAHTKDATNFPFIQDKFKCRYCSESFPRRAQMRQHEELNHGLLGHNKNGSLELPFNKTNNNAILKKKKIGNVRIIKLPNGDKTFQEVTTDNNKPISTLKSQIKTGILIDPIDTKAMHQALAAGRIPFALLKPTKGVPVVVKVQFAAGSKHMLVPASADELRIAGKFTISNPGSGAKAVQIKVPVVATINQRVDGEGQVHMDVEAPEDEEEMVNTCTTEPLITTINNPGVTTTVSEGFVLNHNDVRSSIPEPLITGDDDDQTLQMPILAVEDRISITAPENLDHLAIVEDTNSTMAVGDPASGTVGLLPTTVSLTQDQECIKNGLVNMEGLQYLKQSCGDEGKFDEYEMVLADDPQATHVINQQGDITPIKVDDTGTMTMDQDHISVLMDALQSVGYQISSGDNSGENHHIIINADGNAVMVDNQPVQMVIDGDMQAVVSTEGIVDSVGASSINLVVQKVPEVLTQHPSHEIS